MLYRIIGENGKFSREVDIGSDNSRTYTLMMKG